MVEQARIIDKHYHKYYEPVETPCHYCKARFNDDRLVIIASRHNKPPIFLHLLCWLPYYYSIQFERMIQMSEKKQPNEIKHISEALERRKPWDYTHAELVNTPIVINSFEPISTGYGESLLAKCLIQDEEKNVLIGAVFLMKALMQVQEHLPVRATIIKKGVAYNFE